MTILQLLLILGAGAAFVTLTNRLNRKLAAAPGPQFSPVPLPPRETFPAGITVRVFCDADQSACDAIFASNVGEFLPPDVPLFHRTINEHEAGFLVAEFRGEIVACGGLTLFPHNRQASLWMGLVHRKFHRQHFGTLMLLTRLALIDGDIVFATLETTAVTEPFYAKLGFVRWSEPEKRYAGDHAHFYMYRAITPAECARIREFLRGTNVHFAVDFEPAASANSTA